MDQRGNLMKQSSFYQFYDRAEDIRHKFISALPVIVFFLLMFYSVIFLFGTQYVMVVSLATLLFQVNYKKQHSFVSLLALIAQQMILLVLAHIATLHLAFCLILNLVVPFWLIFSKSSQFNQLGYFSSLMTFTFLQLMHMDWNGFVTQLEAMAFCCAVFFAAVLINFFHMHHMYLRILEDTLTNPPDYWRICDAQLQYHMVHGQIKQDLPKTAGTRQEDYLKVLAITWRMASEIQQMIIHARHRRRGAEARHVMERYIYYTDYVLNLIQEMLHLKKEKRIKNISGMQYQRYIEGEPELSRLMDEYARNLSSLYVLVLQKYQ